MNELLKMSQVLGVKVLNASWVGCEYRKDHQVVCDEIFENGVTLVASAANKENGVKNCKFRESYSYPASYNNVISVSSVGHINPIGFTDPVYGKNNWKDVHEDIPGDTASTHVHNDKVDICAPGYNVLTTDLNGGYTGVWGTSFSGPIVAGVCALVLAANPCLSPEEVEFIIKNTARNLDIIPANQRYIGVLGAGRIDAKAAVEFARDFYTQVETLDINSDETWDSQ